MALLPNTLISRIAQLTAQVREPYISKRCKTKGCGQLRDHEGAHAGMHLNARSTIDLTHKFTGHSARRPSTAQRNLARQAPSPFESPRRNPKHRCSASMHNYS